MILILYLICMSVLDIFHGLMILTGWWIGKWLPNTDWYIPLWIILTIMRSCLSLNEPVCLLLVYIPVEFNTYWVLCLHFNLFHQVILANTLHTFTEVLYQKMVWRENWSGYYWIRIIKRGERVPSLQLEGRRMEILH